MTQDYFLIAPPYLHNRGVSLNIESDIFFYLKKALELTVSNFDFAKFKIDENKKLSLDYNHLKDNLKQNQVVLIDANYEPGDNSNLYPIEIFDLLKKKNNKIVCIVPDLVKNVNLKKWVSISNLLVGFSKSGVEWANEKYETKNFKYYRTFPIPKINDHNNNYNDFIKRPYDIGYIGSNKIFRINFLSSLLRKGGNKISSIFISSFRSSELIKTTKDYLNIMKNCKYYFCTRANIYEKYSKNIFDTKIYDGHFANRINEAIACGCIPIYWQPKKNGYFSALIREKIFHSHYFKSDLFENTSYDKNSLPYDDIDINLLSAIEIVKDSSDALKIIRDKNEDRIKKRLISGVNLYNKYIKPENFLFFIKNELKII